MSNRGHDWAYVGLNFNSRFKLLPAHRILVSAMSPQLKNCPQQNPQSLH